MFPADVLLAAYVEEVRAAEARAQQAPASASSTAPASTVTSPGITRPSTPAINTQLAKEKPAGILSNLWQGFMKPQTLPVSTPTSASSSVASTPATEKSEKEAYAERMREIDICAMRVY